MFWLRELIGMQSHQPSERYALPKRTWNQQLQHYAPIFRWLPHYNIQRDLKYDLVAGVTVAMMLIPQEVSLSIIMHVPANHGLYTAATAPFVYAIFGSSTVLSVSSGSEVSLLVGATLENIQDVHERVATSTLMAFLSGCILLVVRILNLSLIADFFSRPVMGGFISAGGFLIMLSQVPNALGFQIQPQEFPPAKVVEILQHLSETNFNALSVAVVSIMYLLLVKTIKKRFFSTSKGMQLFHVLPPSVLKKDDLESDRADHISSLTGHGVSLNEEQVTTYQEAQSTPQDENKSHVDAGKDDVSGNQPRVLTPKRTVVFLFLMRTLCDLGPLVVCIFGGIVGYTLGPSHLRLTGEIPSGFPAPKVPWYGLTSHLIETHRFGTILYHSLTVAIVVFLSSIAMAKRLAIQRGEDIRTEQELTGIGLASIVCGFFQAVPPTGGMSRTAVNMQNAHTQLSSMITCCLVVLALYTLTNTLYYLPSATLAAIIIVAGSTLIEFQEAKWLYRIKRDEFLVWAASFVLTLGLGVLNGLFASILCCLLALMWKSKAQKVTILGQLDHGTFVDREEVSDTVFQSDVIAIQVESSLYFGNCDRVVQFIEREMVRLSTLGVATRGVVLDARYMNDMDATTIQVLSEIQEKLAVRGVRLAIANAKSRIYDLLAATNLLKRIVASDSTISVEQAVEMMRELPRIGVTRG